MATLAVALVGCEGVPVEPHWEPFYTDDAHYHGEGPRVVILGDSITNAAHDELHNDIGYRSTAIVSASGEGFDGGPWTDYFGATSPIMVLRTQDLGATEPKVAVVSLGTNDAWDPPLAGTDPIPPLDAIYASFDGACTVGVSVAEATSAEAYDVSTAMAINTRIDERADVVVDWRLTADPGDISADGIHLTDQGQEEFVAAVRVGVDACLELIRS